MISNPIIRSAYRLLAITTQITKSCSTDKQEIKNQKKQMALGAAESIRFLLSYPYIKGQQLNLLGQLKKRKISDEQRMLPLSNLIIQHLASKSQIKKKTVEAFKGIFDPREGVILPQHLTTQDRVAKAQNDKKKIAFCPNRLVTVPVFNIVQSNPRKTLMHGSKGISKTISFIFYSYLSQMITNYDFQYDDSVAKDIPRLLYFSYEKSQDTELKISKNLKSHFPQSFINKKNIQKETNVYKIYNVLEQECKKKGIKYNVVIDQFNTFVAECRQFNKKVDEKKKSWQKLQQLRQDLMQKKKLWFQSANSFTSNRYILNSSHNTEHSIIGQQLEPKIGFNLHYHQRATIFMIDFFQSIRSPEAQRQMAHLLLFEIQKICQGEDEINFIKKFKEDFNKENHLFGLKQDDTLVTPLQIRSFLRQKQNNPIKKWMEQSSSSEKSGNQFDKIEAMIIFLKKIGLYKIKQTLIAVKKFCGQGTEELKEEKLFLLLDLRQIIQQKKKNNEKERIIINVQEQMLKKSIKVRPTHQNIDKNLFQLREEGENQKIKDIRLKYSIQDFLKITSFLMSYLQFFFKSIKDEFTFRGKFERATNKTKGQITNDTLVNILKNSGVQLIFNDKDLPIILNPQLPAGYFQHFNQKKNKLSLKVRFQQMLNKIPSNEQGRFVISGVPRTMKGQTSQNSAVIDFIIIQRLKRYKNEKKKNENNENLELINVYSFDITIQKLKMTQKSAGKLTNSMQKITNILEDHYQILKKQRTLKIKQWNHVILCKEQQYVSMSRTVPEKNLKNVQRTKVKCFTSNLKDLKLDLQNQKSRKNHQLALSDYQFFKFIQRHPLLKRD